MKKTIITILFILVVLVALTAVAYYYWHQASTQPTHIVVSTTTSLYQIGLLDSLFSDFKNITGLNVQFDILAKGSGEAIKLLADGSACIAFVHAPSLELQYINQGKIERLAIFAYNEFVIVGPKSDPANVGSSINAIDAFKRIYLAGESGTTKFISRADLSGTNVRELQIWNLTGLDPNNKTWYLKSGQGMSQTLLMADNLNAYTLTDIGTYLSLKGKGQLQNLVILKHDFNYLINVYSMYISKSSSCNDKNVQNLALKLKDYIMNQGQTLITRNFSGLVNPAKGNETMLAQAWESLTKLG